MHRTLCLLLIGLLTGASLAHPGAWEKLLTAPSSTEGRLQQIRLLHKREPNLLYSKVLRPGRRRRVFPLAYALERGDSQLLELLLDLGTETNLATTPGKRPCLHWCTLGPDKGSKRSLHLERLLGAGARPDSIDDLGRNLLHAAAEAKNWASLTSLNRFLRHCRSAGVVLELEDKRGITPLMAAIMRHDARACRALLELGCSPFRKSRILGLDGLTLAEQQSHTLDHPAEAREVLLELRNWAESHRP